MSGSTARLGQTPGVQWRRRRKAARLVAAPRQPAHAFVQPDKAGHLAALGAQPEARCRLAECAGGAAALPDDQQGEEQQRGGGGQPPGGRPQLCLGGQPWLPLGGQLGQRQRQGRAAACSRLVAQVVGPGGGRPWLIGRAAGLVGDRADGLLHGGGWKWVPSQAAAAHERRRDSKRHLTALMQARRPDPLSIADWDICN